jgi:hypothetical protein
MLLASLSSISVSEMPLLDFFNSESQYLASSSGLLLETFGSRWLMTEVQALSSAPTKAWSPWNTSWMRSLYFLWTVSMFSTKSVCIVSP